GRGHSVHVVGEHENQDDRWNVVQQASDERRDKDRRGGNRRDFEPPQNIRFAVRNRAHARAEEAVRENPDREHHSHDLRDHAALFGMEQAAEHEKEHQRKRVVEEQYRAVATGQLQVDRDLREIDPHSRSLFPVSSMKTSSRVGCFRWMSASSRPCWSIHFTSSTMVRAGREDCTLSCFLSSLSVYFVSVPIGPSAAASVSADIGCAHSISISEYPIVFCWISRGVPRAIIFPESIMATRSQSFSASSM